MIELLCGKSPRDTSKTKTALAVFTSQRQASKCVYVRSRIAFDGCFTTHYHHYSKLKKEIALTLQPYADKLREIPPRRVLEVYATAPLEQAGPGASIYHLACKPLGAEEFDDKKTNQPNDSNNNTTNKPTRPRIRPSIIGPTAADSGPSDIENTEGGGNNGIIGDDMKLNDDASSDSSLEKGAIKSMPKITLCRTVPVLALTNNSNGSNRERATKKEDNDKDDDAKSDSENSSKNSGLITGEMVSGAPKLANNFISDNNNRFPAPKMSKASAGSMTAPVVGGSGEIYVMRGNYPKVINKENTNMNKDKDKDKENNNNTST
eukprot:CAMPEP_0201596668 /NCGR_PEP_ID=MMETSP0190_2-20130828/193308_1 /ASSEMBLY_ACC=CAM_ASM_000263 /TAXON_ID=37353 /ORGANISM="Rosalina sp." /LENGTH=319 /DNA_ID=CAMNT_0048057161 /DNA_START=1041 /DNA_END=1996 /DNA_ORIENTATION=-